MYQTYSLKEKFNLFLTVMWPIVVTQIGLHAMGVVDTMMSGRAGTDDLAGVAIGASLWMPAFLLANGILLAVMPTVAQLIGSGKKRFVSGVVMQALYLSAAVSIVIIGIGMCMLEPILTSMNLDAPVHHIAKHYLIGLSLGIVPLFLSGVLRNFFDAQGYTKVTMKIILLAVPMNVCLNYVMIFGKFGFPRLGGIGAGYATALTYWFIAFISIWTTFKLEAMRDYRLFLSWPRPSWTAWKEQLGIGVPIGLSIFFEASIFSAVTLLLGISFDTVTIASNQAAISIAGLLFMIPLSISLTLTIIIGYEVGAGRWTDARQYTLLGVATALGVMIIAAVALFFNREWVASLYTTSEAVAAMIMQFLIFVIFFQFSDAAQASLQGVLRGYKDVTFPFVTALLSYWVIGIPTGYMLASYTGLGPFGYWVGITFGLTCAAIGFFSRLVVLQRKLRAGERG